MSSMTRGLHAVFGSGPPAVGEVAVQFEHRAPCGNAGAAEWGTVVSVPPPPFGRG